MKNKKEPSIIERIDSLPMPGILEVGFNRYAKAVILDRAIPDVRDGLKPVQRRIIYTMFKENNVHSRPTIKCARTVGNVIGKYHPHGDYSVYDAMVRLSQDWKMEIPLLEFQGNNGSIDNDPAAAYRYTEARLAAMADYMVMDLDKDTVDMMLNFDDTEKEPTVLPARFPNLLVNGANGIAVGASTSIPTHNLNEVINAVIYRLSHKNATVTSLREFILGPDFPTGGIIDDKEALNQLYETGQASFTINSKIDYTSEPNKIIISDIPYGEVKSNFVANLDKKASEGKIDAINEIRDESTDTIRIVIELKKDADPIPVVNFLRSKGAFRTTFSANMLAIDDCHPRVLNLLDMIDAYINHQKDVILRRCQYDLKKKIWRLSIVKGLIKAVSILDEVIKLIRESSGKEDSKNKLIERYGFNPEQSEAIVTLQLYRLSNTDVTVLHEEEERLTGEIKELHEIIDNEDKLIKLISNDLKAINKQYITPRKTMIVDEKIRAESVDARSLIAKDFVQVVVTHDGYIKRSAKRSYDSAIANDPKSLPRLKISDYTILNQSCSTHDYAMLFTSKGQYFVIPVFMIEDTKWKDEGKHLNNIVSIESNDKIVSGFIIENFIEGLYVTITTKNGKIKRSSLKDYEQTKLTTKGLKAINLVSKDQVVSAVITHGDSDVIVITEKGVCSRYNENNVTVCGLKAAGVKALDLNKDTGSILTTISLLKDETSKLMLLSDSGCVRLLSVVNISSVERLQRKTKLVTMLKNSPIKIVGAIKVKDRRKDQGLVQFVTKQSLSSLDIANLDVSSIGIRIQKNINELDSDIVGICMNGELVNKDTVVETPVKMVSRVFVPEEDNSMVQLSLFGDEDED